MASMDTDELPVVLPSSTTSGLSLALYVDFASHRIVRSFIPSCSHPLPILNISEHLTRLKLQTRSSQPFGKWQPPTYPYTSSQYLFSFLLVIGALLGTQNGREVEIVNSFELAMENDNITVDQGFLVARKDQCTCFPSSCANRVTD